MAIRALEGKIMDIERLQVEVQFTSRVHVQFTSRFVIYYFTLPYRFALF